MADHKDDQERDPTREASDAELSGRLGQLDAAVRKIRAERKVDETPAVPDRTSAAAGMTLAFRLGSEFVASVLVGAGLGWGLDKLLGTTPWGMIVLLLLGFGAGIVNMMRAAGEGRRK